MPPALSFLSSCCHPVTNIGIGRGQGPCTVSPIWKGYAANYDLPACSGNLLQEPRSSSSAHKGGRLIIWRKHRMWERNQLSLGRVPLGWQEALRLTQTHLEASSSLEWWEELYGQSASEDNRAPNSCQFSEAIESEHWTLSALNIALESVRTSGIMS